MFGKGAKRKLDEDEEGLEGKALEGACPGVAPPPGGVSKASYTLQRQTIFNISLLKLYSGRCAGAEPRLQRRVLINNVLRRIQEELRAEGELRPLLLPPSPPPHHSMDDAFREAPPSFGVLAAQVSLMPAPPPHPPPPPSPMLALPPGSSPAPPGAGLTPASLLEDVGEGGVESFCSEAQPTPPPPTLPLPPRLLPLPPPSALSDVELRPPTAITRTAAADSTATSPLPLPAPPPRVKPDVLLADALPALPPAGLVDMSSYTPPPPAYPPHASPPPSGFLSDLALDDILFADIDTSMYDFDPCTTAAAAAAAAAGGGGGARPLSPVVTADDLLKSLTSPYSGPAPQVAANQPFKMDLTELDHIMEVLVGS